MAINQGEQFFYVIHQLDLELQYQFIFRRSKRSKSCCLCILWEIRDVNASHDGEGGQEEEKGRNLPKVGVFTGRKCQRQPDHKEGERAGFSKLHKRCRSFENLVKSKHPSALQEAMGYYCVIT